MTMTDLTTATDAAILAAVKTRSDAKIAEAMVHVDALLAILDPSGSILQHTPAEGAARSVHNSCTTFKRIADQLAALSTPADASAEAPTA